MKSSSENLTIPVHGYINQRMHPVQNENLEYASRLQTDPNAM